LALSCHGLSFGWETVCEPLNFPQRNFPQSAKRGANADIISPRCSLGQEMDIPSPLPPLPPPHEGPPSFLRPGSTLCEEPGCNKLAVPGPVVRCVAHGGGKRCQEPSGCTKSAVGTSNRCVAHGGGKRCTDPGCSKSGVGPTGRCMAHGGGRRCEEPGCQKSARSYSARRTSCAF